LAILGVCLPALGAEALQESSQRTVVVNVLAYGTAATGKAVGNCNPVRVSAGGTDDGRVVVGFFESEVGGSGDQWRSAGWTAAVTAGLLADSDAQGMRVSFEYVGRVDGPSAGGLMTVGVLAALRGDAMKPDVAMTGTINPDGTIGPVGGIPHKIDGAAAKGMKQVLIPGGIRFDLDKNLGQQVDLVERGRQQGIEVVEVFDVYTAYGLLTGVELPRPPRAEAPRIGLDAQQHTQDKMALWYRYYQTALDSYAKMPGQAKLSQEIIDLYQEGVECIKRSDQLKTEGEFTAAWFDRVQAAVYGYLALEAGRCRQAYAAGGYRGMVSRLRANAWLDEEIKKTTQRLRNETPKTMDQLSMYLIACDSFLEALGLQLMARTTLSRLPAAESDAANELAFDAATNQIIAWLDLRMTGDYLDLMRHYEGRPIPERGPWRQTADYLRRAADANMAVFNSLVIAPNAKGLKMSEELVQSRLMSKDRVLAVTVAATDSIFPRLGEYFGSGDAFYYGYLATSIYTHTRAACLLAKYYSLTPDLDSDMNVVKLTKERTLSEWLNFAEDQSSRSIAALQARGVDATPVAQLHELARIKARRDLVERLEGLSEFWAADLHAQVLRRLSVALPEPAGAAN